MTCATYWLRGLWRLLPDPCAKSTTPLAPTGTFSSPSSTASPDGICTSCSRAVPACPVCPISASFQQRFRRRAVDARLVDGLRKLGDQYAAQLCFPTIQPSHARPFCCYLVLVF